MKGNDSENPETIENSDSPAEKNYSASSPESVGEFRLRQVSKLMI
jgi:hypothetical protein